MRILFFDHLKNVTGQGDVELPVGAVDLNGLWEKLLAAYPDLARYRSSVRVACNWEYVGAGAHFTDADEVALIPPVSGG